MRKRRSAQIVVTYVVSLVAAIAMLVVWLIYVVRSGTRLNELAERVGVTGSKLHWTVLGVSSVLFFLLIIGLTYQLAQTLAARRYSEKQEEFISNVTHEMKSPLAAIKLHAQTLQQGPEDSETSRRSLGFILQQAERMSTLVDNVLESSRLAARRQRPTLVPVDLALFFESYAEEIKGQLGSHGVEIGFRVKGAIEVMASEESLRRVMDNLLENAVKFSQRGGQVWCRVGGTGQLVRIEVEDQGLGIPSSELSKVFDRFYQIGREISGRRGGTGLGLSIVAELVREMKGRVRAYCPEGRPGTCFVVELPALGGRE